MGAIDSDALKEYIKKTDLTAVERGALLQAISNMPTLTPPNEPLTLDKKRMIAKSCLHYSKSGSCTLRGYAPLDCPRCKEWQSNESNEPLTLEELREMDGEPVYMTFPSDTGNQCGHWALVGTQRWGAVSLIYGCGWSSYESAVETLGAKFYRRPPEGEGDGAK